MDKPVYLGPSILEISKMVMHRSWYDCVKPKVGGKAKLSYMDTKSFKVYIETQPIYVDIANDVETISDSSNYELERQLPRGKNKKSSWIITNELDGKIMTDFAALIPKIRAI